jgi:hypothetical protein
MPHKAASLLLLAIGCVSDPESLDPTGNWSMTLSWSHGDCQLTGSFDAQLTVIRSPDGFAIDESRPEVQVAGSVLCTPSLCTLSFTESGPGPTGSGVARIELAAHLQVDDLDAVNGSGKATYRFESGASCEQMFLATGSLR